MRATMRGSQDAAKARAVAMLEAAYPAAEPVLTEAQRGALAKERALKLLELPPNRGKVHVRGRRYPPMGDFWDDLTEAERIERLDVNDDLQGRLNWLFHQNAVPPWAEANLRTILGGLEMTDGKLGLFEQDWDLIWKVFDRHEQAEAPILMTLRSDALLTLLAQILARGHLTDQAWNFIQHIRNMILTTEECSLTQPQFRWLSALAERARVQVVLIPQEA